MNWSVGVASLEAAAHRLDDICRSVEGCVNDNLLWLVRIPSKTFSLCGELANIENRLVMTADWRLGEQWFRLPVGHMMIDDGEHDVGLRALMLHVRVEGLNDRLAHRLVVG